MNKKTYVVSIVSLGNGKVLGRHEVSNLADLAAVMYYVYTHMRNVYVVLAD